MDGGVRARRQMSPKVQGLVETMQPYHAEKGTREHPLAVLNDLSNIDKHRHLTFTGAVSTAATFTLRPDSQDVVLLGHQTEVRYGAFDDQTDVARMLVKQTGPNPKVGVDANITIDIAFPESGPAPGKLVLGELERIYLHIRENIFPVLEKEL